MRPSEQPIGQSRRPNVIFLFADEWRAQATGYNGDTNCETPVLDALAGRSIDLTEAVAGCSVCCPYRGSLLTGQYPLSHGVIINDVELDPSCTSVADAFSAGGYQTSYIGKWHLYGSPGGEYERREASVPREYQLRAFAQSREAAAYIRDHAAGERPFLLLLSWGPPHFPLHTAPEEYRARYADRVIELRPNVPAQLADKAVEELRGYYAHVAAIDDALAIVLDAVREAGIEEETILVVTSDHGDMRQSQGLDTKLFPWDESVRVPFLLRWPQLHGAEARKLPLPLDTPDIMPTLLGLCDLEVPATVEGRDWSPVLRGEAALSGDEAALLNMPVAFGELIWNDMSPYRGLRSARYSYVRNLEGPWLLYDNVADPYQKRNLISSAEHAGLQAGLDRCLQQRLAELGDEFLSGRSYLERAGLTHYQETRQALRQRTWTDPWTDASS